MDIVSTDRLLDSPVFQDFYHLVRNLFGLNLAISVIRPDGFRGRVLRLDRDLNAFCQAIKRTKEGEARCRECDIAHMRLAERQQQPLHYTCHAGFTEFVIPIVVDGQALAVMQCGQIIDRPACMRQWKAVCRRLDWRTTWPDSLRQRYWNSPVISPEKQRDLMSLLQMFAQNIARSHKYLLLLQQSAAHQIVARAQTHMTTHIQDKFRLDDLAFAVGSSRRHLVRVFRKQTGTSVLEYLHRLRVARACERLKEPEAKILAVALECGFGSIQQFNRVFKRLHHTTPSRWREREWRGSA